MFAQSIYEPHHRIDVIGIGPRHLKSSATSFHVAPDDLDLTPFDALGGLGKFYQLFGSNYESILNELNERLVA